MKLRWEWKAITNPSEIESHNNMVETLWKWRHAGLVAETESSERLPELINTPKRLMVCKCGNDDLHKFTLMSLSDCGTYAMNRYTSGGKIEASHQETDYIPGEIAEEFGLARKLAPGKNDDGTEYPRWDWKWLIKCDKCKSREAVWNSELDSFIDWT